MTFPRPATWLLICAGVAIALLAAVHLMESVGGYPPCELCLRQREAVWTVLAISLAGWTLGRWRPVLLRVALVAVAIGWAVGAGVAAYHAGVEWKWWPGPATCTGKATGPVSAAQVAAVLSGVRAVHLVRCDDAALVIGPLSLAGWNAVLSAALSLASLAVLGRKERA